MPWYLITDIFLWTVTVLVLRWSWPQIGKISRITAATNAVWIMLLQTTCEILSRKLNVWTFAYDHNTMIGINLMGEPIEEYLFWWAYAWVIPFGYYGLVAWFNRKDQAKGLTIITDVQE